MFEGFRVALILFLGLSGFNVENIKEIAEGSCREGFGQRRVA